MAEIYTFDTVPLSKTWIYYLDKQQSIAQCRALNIIPTEDLRLNRKLLSNLVSTLATARQGPTPLAQPSLMDAELPLGTAAFSGVQAASQHLISPASSSIFANSSLAWDYDFPPNTWPSAITTSAPLPMPNHTSSASYVPRVPFSLTCVTATSTRPTTSVGGLLQIANPVNVPQTTCQSANAFSLPTAVPPQQQQPSQPTQEQQWAQIIQATATAVGTQMAAVFRDCQPQTPIYGNGGSRVLADLLRTVPETSGSDAVKLVQFLAMVQRIAGLNLGDQDNLLLSLLGKTTGQLHSLWIRAVATRVPVLELVHELLNYFVPLQLRHSLVTQLVFRAQASRESIPEYVADIQSFASLLLPHLTERDVLEAALHGLNPATRARMAGLPSPSTLDALLQLAPRIELVRQLELPVDPVRTPPLMDPPHQPNHTQTNRQNYSGNRAEGFRRQPEPRGGVQNGIYRRDPAYPNIPPFPFNSRHGNLNFRGGRR